MALLTIPKGYSTKDINVNGKATTVLVAKRQSRGGYKTPKKVRDRIAASARKLKLPVLTIGANLPAGLGVAGAVLTTIQQNDLGTMEGQRRITNSLTLPYLGVGIDAGNQIVFRPKELLKGFVPNVMVALVNKTGIFRGTNQKLAKTKLPFRLS